MKDIFWSTSHKSFSDEKLLILWNFIYLDILFHGMPLQLTALLAPMVENNNFLWKASYLICMDCKNDCEKGY